MHNQRIQTLIVLAAVLGGICALAESPLRAIGAYGWTRKLYLKGAESIIDETIRQAMRSGNPAPGHEEYELGSQASLYEDQAWGTYGGTRMTYQVRRMWLDAATGAQSFTTWMDGKVVDRDPFFYVLHKQTYDCVAPGALGQEFEYHLRAMVNYRLLNRVLSVDTAHAVQLHPVTYEFGLQLLTAHCNEWAPEWEFAELGSGRIARNGSIEVTPWLPDVDVTYCLVWYYDEK